LLFKSMFCWKKDWDWSGYQGERIEVAMFKSMFCWKKDWD